jgi:hypothetical protein
MPMMLPFFTRLVALVAVGLCLAGCGRTEAYRYKLTLAVNTPNGVKRASTVTEWMFWAVSIPARGTPHKVRGEALYLDLGPGSRPLIALMTSHLHEKEHIGVVWDWPDDSLLSRLYGGPWRDDFMEGISRLAKMYGPRRIAPADLPDLVTFANVNDPESVIEVNRNDLQATLGQDITWHEITFEMTDEPVTSGVIKSKLPWLSTDYGTMLDGEHGSDGRSLANKLSTADFDQSGDLKGSK